MTQDIKFEESVILIDSEYLNKVISDLTKHFETVLSRKLPKADLPTLLECICLDSGIKTETKDIQTIFIYDKDKSQMESVNPSDLAGFLKSTSFKSVLGDFLINSFESNDMATKNQLFIESLKLMLDSKDIKNLLIVPSEQDNKEELLKLFKEENKIENIKVFGMIPMEPNDTFKWEMLGFAILKSLGIKSDEL